MSFPNRLFLFDLKENAIFSGHGGDMALVETALGVLQLDTREAQTIFLPSLFFCVLTSSINTLKVTIAPLAVVCCCILI